MNTVEYMRQVEFYRGVKQRLNPKPVAPPPPPPERPKFIPIVTPLQKIINECVKPALKGTGFTLEDVRGDRRFHDLCKVRWKICEALFARGWPKKKIGAFINKDHTTVVNALKHMKKEKENGTEK
jgi:hypothetical protein